MNISLEFQLLDYWHSYVELLNDRTLHILYRTGEQLEVLEKWDLLAFLVAQMFPLRLII